MNINAPVGSFFHKNPEVMTKLATALSQPGLSDWESLAIEMSRELSSKITMTFLNSIKHSNASEFERAKSFLTKISVWTEVTTRTVGVALKTIGQGVIACEHFGVPLPVADSEALYKRFARDETLAPTLIKFFCDPENPSWANLAVKLSTKCNGEWGNLIQRIPSRCYNQTEGQVKLFFKEISQWPQLTSRHLGEAIKELELDQMAYQHFGIPLAVAPKPPVGMGAYLAEFLKNTGMEDDIVEALSENTAPNWYTLARALSKLGDSPLSYSKPKVDSYKTQGNDAASRTRAFFSYLKGCATLKSFIIGLYCTDRKFWPLCEEMCEKAGDKNFYRTLPELAQRSIVPPQPINNQQGMEISLYDLFKKCNLEWDIWEALLKPEAPNWETVANMLVSQPKFHNHKEHLVNNVKRYQANSEDRSSDFIGRSSQLILTVGEFVTAIAAASGQFKELARLICRVAGSERFFHTLQFPKEMPAAAKGPEVKPDAQLLFDQLLESEKALKEQNERLKKAFEDAQKNIQQANAVQADPLTCRSCLKKRVTKSIDCGHAGYCDLCIGIIKSCPSCYQPVRNPRTLFFN